MLRVGQMQNELKTQCKDGVTVIFVKTRALKRPTVSRRLKFHKKSSSKWIKLLHKRLESMNNTIEGVNFVKGRF